MDNLIAIKQRNKIHHVSSPYFDGLNIALNDIFHFENMYSL